MRGCEAWLCNYVQIIGHWKGEGRRTHIYQKGMQLVENPLHQAGNFIQPAFGFFFLKTPLSCFGLTTLLVLCPFLFLVKV
jgi:hypothetical protein